MNGASPLRPIDPSIFAPVDAPFQPGPAPMLQWIKIADLVVDDAYQRPIYGAGRINVRKIAAAFSWSKFAPVIVAPVEGGHYAIIDGQHRTTAAALCGVVEVPCQVVVAIAEEQARAFRSINGQVTRIHALALHRAAMAAGDPAAAEIDEAASAAGVEILRYPLPVDKLKPGQTLALGAITEGLRAFGRETIVTALGCVTRTSNNIPGALSGAVIRALCAVLGGNARWRQAGPRLRAAFEEIDLATELEEAKLTRRPKGVAHWEVLAARLRQELTEALGEQAA